MSGPDDAARAERLAAALRANLKRRKQQARGRQADAPADPPAGEGAPIARPAPPGPDEAS
ncbi:hypothetical protein FHS55_000094 [Angulomicrobium tetraedrale]|uniref:Uncharacterized protein n=1 Tax=Ancylobacter tetraedralis TaxID=217068 RepID=A0A839Z632_9HYPH|nr:hypothetical protein [Ancylobacter tetraedralis]MBB3769508.1 hypothetical protein [Ancylobacter tetraedralis]